MSVKILADTHDYLLLMREDGMTSQIADVNIMPVHQYADLPCLAAAIETHTDVLISDDANITSSLIYAYKVGQKVSITTLPPATYSLQTMPYQMTYFEVRCLLFELIVTYFLCAKDELLSVDVNSILLLEVDVDRDYTVDGIQYNISSKYLPMYTHTQKSPASPDDFKTNMTTFLMENVDWSDPFYNEYVDLMENLRLSSDILRHPFFDDMQAAKEINKNLRNRYIFLRGKR